MSMITRTLNRTMTMSSHL